MLAQIKRFMLLGVVFLFLPLAQAGVGISTTLAGLLLEQIEIGRTYDVGKHLGRTFEVRNNGQAAVNVRIQGEKPTRQFLKDGFKAGAAQWLGFEPNAFILEPGQIQEIKVFLQIPKDRWLKGDKVQISVWIYTVGENLVQAGLRGQIQILVDK